MKSNKKFNRALRWIRRQNKGQTSREKGRISERTLYLQSLPSLNPSSAGVLPSSFDRADVNSLTGLSSKCLIRSGKNDLFNTSGPIK